MLAFSNLTIAQNPLMNMQKLEGVWQVSMQKTNKGTKFMPPVTKDFKIFYSNGSFKHIIYSNGNYVEVSRGNIRITSDSTYTEELDKHIGAVNVKKGYVIYKFLDKDTFLMKWSLSSFSGEELYERVK